jgi:hypothetical protein
VTLEATASSREWYLERRVLYTDRALRNAFPGDGGEGWDPTLGWRANRDRVLLLYDYYRDLFERDPERFLWAGLARLAGGAVVSGLDAIPDDDNFVVWKFLEAGRDIFRDLAWQHEVAIDAPGELLELAALHDAEIGPRVSYANAWAKVMGTGGDAEIARQRRSTRKRAVHDHPTAIG